MSSLEPKPVAVGVRKICCSQCVGTGVYNLPTVQSPLAVNRVPPTPIICPQCRGEKTIDVLVPIPNNGTNSQPSAPPNTSQKIP